MEEEDDDDEWWPQQFYLDVISGACEPIGGELSGQFPGTAQASTDLFFFFFFCFVLFCFVLLFGGFVFCVCLSVWAVSGHCLGQHGPFFFFFFFFFFFLGFSFLCQLNCFRAQRRERAPGGWSGVATGCSHS